MRETRATRGTRERRATREKRATSVNSERWRYQQARLQEQLRTLPPALPVPHHS